MTIKKRTKASTSNETQKLLPEDDHDSKKEEATEKLSKPAETAKYFSKHRVWSRFVMIVCVMAYVWYTSKTGKEISLAKQKDVLQNRGQSFPCDPDYLSEIEEFPSCKPKKCGRFVSDKLVTSTEANILLSIAKKGFSLGGSDGGASILDLHSGALSYGEKFINIYSLEDVRKIFNSADLMVYKVVKEKIQHAIAEAFQIDHKSLHLTHPTFFSRLTNLEPKTDHDEYWHIHVDKVTYESFHYTSLLYLSDFGAEFSGGRLIWLDTSEGKNTNNVTMEPRKGRVAMFTSGAENPHFVERVTKGTRFAITVSFTCDITKSIKDPGFSTS